MVGIVGYGAYVPAFRIKASTIADQWGDDIVAIERGLLMKEKTVPGKDEDTITISVAAAKNAVKRAGIDPQKIGAVYIGSESHPYAVKPSGTVLIDALGIGPDVHVADFEFACKAGSEAMFVAYSHVKSGNMDNVIAEVLHTHSFTTDTADFWRREYQHYPRHGGRFTGEPAYFKHLLGCGKLLLEKSKMKASDFAYAVFHMPNGKFPLKGGEILGFKKEQMEQGWLVNIMGNTYSGSSPTGLTAILDVAKPGDKIFMVSFGSGAGSDGFIFKATPRITQVQNKAPKTRDMLNGKKIYLDYGKYAAFRRKIKFLE